MLFFFYEIALISAVVQIGLALPMVVYFHRLGFPGLSANAFVVPLMGLARAGGFRGHLHGLGLGGAGSAGWLLAFPARSSAGTRAVEPNWRIPTPPLWLAVAFSAALIGAALALQPAAGGAWPRWPSVAVAARRCCCGTRFARGFIRASWK